MLLIFFVVGMLFLFQNCNPVKSQDAVVPPLNPTQAGRRLDIHITQAQGEAYPSTFNLVLGEPQLLSQHCQQRRTATPVCRQFSYRLGYQCCANSCCIVGELYRMAAGNRGCLWHPVRPMSRLLLHSL